MASVNKQSCPTCGQSVNKREIVMYKGLMDALFIVWRYCEENNRSGLKMKEIKPLINEVSYSRFNDLKRFIPEAVRGPKGLYDLNMSRLRDIFTGKQPFCTRMLKDPLQHTLERSEYSYIGDLPNLSEMLINNEEFISQYRGAGEIEQTRLV